MENHLPVTAEWLLTVWKGRYYDESNVIQVGSLFFKCGSANRCWRVDVWHEYRHDFHTQEEVVNREQFIHLMKGINHEQTRPSYMGKDIPSSD